MVPRVTVCCGGEALQQEQKVESARLEPQTQSRESALGMARGFETSKPAPVMDFLQQGHASPNSTTSQEPGVQTQEPVETFSLNPTGPSFCKRGHYLIGK